MTCETPCFGMTHQQGKDCECATNASRAALGLPPLHQQDGGHRVNGGISFPMQPGDGMREDEPLYTPESVSEPMPLVIWIATAIAAIACLAVMVWH